MKISPARVAAFDILTRISRDRAFSSILLHELESNLPPGDRALCHNLTLGVLRRQIYLDRFIDNLTGDKKLDPAVRIALQLGLYQLHFLDRVPDHSAVNESVNLVQKAKKTSAKGLVNAVLRRSLREALKPEGRDELDRIVLGTSHPRWLLEKWADRWGLDETKLLAAANNEPPAAAFRKSMLSDKCLTFADAIPSQFVNGCFISPVISPEIRAAANRGEIYFQDEGSQLVGSLIDLEPGEKFIDICAAPGSKLTQIASRSPKNTILVGGDIHTARVRFLRENCRRQGLDHISIIQYDAERQLPFDAGVFDFVLVDAPCSGTGTIRHNPELRYFIERGDFVELSEKQRRLLKNASNLVKPGGTLIYSTCSMEMEENETVADLFLSIESEFTAVRPDVPAGFITRDGRIQTLPHRDGTDGFFVAIFRRAGP